MSARHWDPLTDFAWDLILVILVVLTMGSLTHARLVWAGLTLGAH